MNSLNTIYLILISLRGESGIRTLGTIAGTTVFETAPIDHSGNSPSGLQIYRNGLINVR